jgi:lysylphosphatidylglycerol synthetase-like protein (DUF2156 family)
LELSEEQDPADADEPRRFLPDGRPMATKRTKKKPGSTVDVSVQESDLVPDLVAMDVSSGSRVLVVGDLALSQTSSEASEAFAAEFARTLVGVRGSCVLILAGNTFDLVGDALVDPARALSAHARLSDAILAFGAKDGRRVVLLPGDRDGCLAWNPAAVATVGKRLGAEVAIAAEVTLHTGDGDRRVRVEPGHRFDPFDAFEDPRNPGETPLGHYAHQALGNLRRQVGGWLDGIQLLADPTQVSAFVASRLFYRRLLRRFSWVLAPLAVALVCFAASLVLHEVLPARSRHVAQSFRLWAAALGLGGVALIAVCALLALVWWWTVREPLQAMSLRSIGGLRDGDEPNEAARAAAGRLVGQGFTGLITAHTDLAELTELGGGFYANVGCGGKVAARRPGRFGAPDAWVVGQQQSWIELEAGATLHSRLHFARQQPPNTTLLERLATRDVNPTNVRPEVVSTWPAGTDWPVPPPQGLDRRRARRIGAAAIAFAGIIDLVSAVVPPLHGRFEAVQDVVPLAVSQAAAMAVALFGLLLLLVARGIRRGLQHAWIAAEVALFATFVLHVVKGLDFEEAIVAAVIGLYLLANRRHFRVRSDEWSVTRGLAVLVGGGLAAVTAAVVTIKLMPGHRHEELTWMQAIKAGFERMVGITTVPVGPRLDQFLLPVMVTISVGLVAYAGWIVFGPVVAKRLVAPAEEDADRARQIVATSGGDTLAYFALRDDKRWFFHGETLIAYAVTQGVALVSPDPIGPVADRRRAWFAFRQFADDHGWPIAVMGASEEWLPIYRASGMREMYVGDEAVADVRRFSLEGGRNKGLRQAVNRIANNGYRMEFHDPADLAPEIEAALRGLMTESRRGEMERGFSMTLGRIFDPRDKGLLLAICFGPDGRPAAFCQYVPAPAIDGYSLDLMRRSERPDHPNGLTDFVVVETMHHLREQGMVGLGLNFATMRGVLAGERGDTSSRRVERWFYRKMSDSMQIESLWRYNEKFDPDWVPRFACYDSAEHLLASATALAKAESWWDIPVVGRFFKPDGGQPVGAGDDPGAPGDRSVEVQHDAATTGGGTVP